MACSCVKKECGTGKGGVKGYVTTALCPECSAQREADAITAAAQKEREDIELMIAQKVQALAKEQLIKDGVLSEVDGKLKKV